MLQINFKITINKEDLSKMGKVIRFSVLTSIFFSLVFITQSWASHNHDMGMHDVAQMHLKETKKPIEILWPKKGDVVKAKEIEVKIRVADELKDMVGHIHVYLNGKRLDHASIKEDTLLLWDLKEGENVLELALAQESHDEHSGGKIIKDSVSFKVKTK